MRKFTKVPIEFWTSSTGKKLKHCEPETKILAFYLMTSSHSNALGLYYFPFALASHEIGITTESVRKSIESLIKIGFCSYDEENEYVWVHQTAEPKLNVLNKNDTRINHVNNIYKTLPFTPLLKDFYQKYGETYYLEPPVKNANPFNT